MIVWTTTPLSCALGLDPSALSSFSFTFPPLQVLLAGLSGFAFRYFDCLFVLRVVSFHPIFYDFMATILRDA